MPPAETPIAALQRLLDAGLLEEAVHAADALIASNRRSFAAWVGRARANWRLGRTIDADRDVDEALRLAPGDPQAGLIRASIDQRLGRIDAAVARLRRQMAGTGPPSRR
jgi:tetratricopeptide (TPR) repeat protein